MNRKKEREEEFTFVRCRRDWKLFLESIDSLKF